MCGLSGVWLDLAKSVWKDLSHHAKLFDVHKNPEKSRCNDYQVISRFIMWSGAMSDGLNVTTFLGTF